MPRKFPLVYLSSLPYEPAAPEPQEFTKSQPAEQAIQNALRVLPYQLREVVERRFGFTGEEESLESIGNRFHVSREAVRQWEQRALAQLRKKLMEQGFADCP